LTPANGALFVTISKTFNHWVHVCETSKTLIGYHLSPCYQAHGLNFAVYREPTTCHSMPY
jgi:hypothetical protein